jgi:hypothetical protein
MDLVERVRTICLAFPGVTEKLSHGAPGFFVGKQFVTLWWQGHHHHDFPHLWCAAPPGAQDELVGTGPYFRPPYVGHRGWLGVRLDGDIDKDIDWEELREVLEDAYRTVAPARLVAQL